MAAILSRPQCVKTGYYIFRRNSYIWVHDREPGQYPHQWLPGDALRAYEFVCVPLNTQGSHEGPIDNNSVLFQVTTKSQTADNP